MKKLLILIFSCVLLVGCTGGSGDASNTTVCSMTVDDATEEVTFTSENDIITTMKLKNTVAVSDLDQTSRDMLLLTLDAQYNNSSFNNDGVTTKYEITDDNLIITIEVSDKDKAAVIFNDNRNFIGGKLEDAVAEIESAGATCK